MNHQLLLSILLELLHSRKITASELAAKYRVSARTVYRYVDDLRRILPLYVQRGRLGGIYLSDSYRLPVDFLTREEYESVVNALHLSYAACPSQSLLSARQKITAATKNSPARIAAMEAGNLLVLSTKGESLSDILQALQSPLKEKKNVRIFYLTDDKAREHVVEPHTLAYLDGEWYLCGFCHTRREFFPFALSNICGVFRTNERFRPRKFNAETLLSGIPCTH